MASTLNSENKKAASSASSSMIKRSVLLCGLSGCGKSSKLYYLATLAEKAKLNVEMIRASALQYRNYGAPDVVTCSDIETIKQLKLVIKIESSSQMFLGTTLTTEELESIKDKLTSLNFDIYHFEPISLEERAKYIASFFASGEESTICRDWGSRNISAKPSPTFL